MNKAKKRMIFPFSLLLLAFLFLLWGSVLYTQAASKQYRMNIEIFVDGVGMGYIPAVDDSYENNLYVSLKGLAYALGGTAKAFTTEIEPRKITITMGAGNSSQPPVWDEEELSDVSTATPAPHEMYVNESERKYYSFIFSRDEEYDAFITPVSLAMMFDLDIKVSENRIEIDTTTPYSVSAEEMEASGYLQGVDALVIGDGSTGEIYYQYDADKALPIASTTKLMTYFLFMDAVSQGSCSLEDTVVISEKAEKISDSPDGAIPMKAGSQVPARELLYGMLLPSSNECALAIAEHVAGSEEAFVVRMNEKAKEFGWENTEFYNCHGLPRYEDQLIPAKVQNHMSAEEMFELASAIMDTYPQITEFTSTRKYRLESFQKEIKNTNAVLYNIDSAVGLKTGTTNKAGACLVTCVEAEKDGQTHHLITVLFGAESDSARGTVSEMSARYAMRALQENGTNPQGGLGENEKVIPIDPEKVMRELIRQMN